MSGTRIPTIPVFAPPAPAVWRSQLEQQQARRQDPPAPPAPPADPATPPAEPTPPTPPAYTPPASQADLDRIIQERVARERARYSDYADLQARAARVDELERANQTESERALAAARDEGRAEVQARFTTFQVNTALGGALTGRNVDPVALLDLDRSRFIRDGAPDLDGIRAWVEAHSTAATAPAPPAPPVTTTPDPSQGGRGAATSLDAGRAAYDRRHGKTTN